MAKLNIAPTKSNLLALTEDLHAAQDGYELLEQKREILVMELMKMLDKVKLLEKEIQAQINVAYPSLRHMFVAVGRNRAERFAKTVSYDFKFTEKSVFFRRNALFVHCSRTAETAACLLVSGLLCRLRQGYRRFF